MRFVETPIFTRIITRLDDEEYRSLQIALMLRPEQGPIRGAGGLRKVRWAMPGSGKRGGLRVIYYWAPRGQTFYIAVCIFEERTGGPDSSAGAPPGTTGPRGIQVKEAAFRELVASVRQAGRIRRGRLKAGRTTVFRPTDVQAVRAKLGASQTEFALMIGVSVATLRNWEQGRRTPDGPALALLRVAAKNPKAVAEALHGSRGAA
jgi:putative transcriptional regulator